MKTTHKRLLVIDDEPGICRLVNRVAKPLGFEAQEAFDFSDAEQKLRDFDPTVIVLDLSLPGRDGSDLLRDLARRDCRVPIILISGLAGNALESAELLGAQQCQNVIGSLQKPLSLSALSELLNKASVAENCPIPEVRMKTRLDPIFGVEAAHCKMSGMWVRLPKLNDGTPISVRTRSGPLQDQTELLRNITDNLLMDTVMHMVAWKKRGLSMFAAVAVSPTLFNDAGIPERLMNLMQEYNVSPQNLTLDITHDDLGSFSAEMLDVLLRLRANGFQLMYELDTINHKTINDAFAASVTVLGLRPSVLSACANSRNVQGYLQAAIVLAHRADLTVWVHGISDSKLLTIAQDLNCDFVDGQYPTSRFGVTPSPSDFQPSTCTR